MTVKRTKMHKTWESTNYFVSDEDGNVFGLPVEPRYDDDLIILVSGDAKKAIVGYLAQDNTWSPDDDDPRSRIIILNRDYMGPDDAWEYAKAMGLEYDGGRTFTKPDPASYDCPEDVPKPYPDALPIDAYIHSGAVIALSDSAQAANFPDRRWDVSRGVWFPIGDLQAELESLEPAEREKRRREAAEEDIDRWNAIGRGEIFRLIVIPFKWDERGHVSGNTRLWQLAEHAMPEMDWADVCSIIGHETARKELEQELEACKAYLE